MTSQKLMISLSTIPNESKIYAHDNSLSYSTNDIRLPYKESLPLKFPKRQIRKQTQMHMLKQSNPNPQKSSIRNFYEANKSKIFDQPQRKKRMMNQGLFHSLSKQTPQIMPLNRSVQDIGAPNNRKRVVQPKYLKPDPITVGTVLKKHNSALQKVWIQPRRHRDNGKKCEQTFNWNTQKSSSYLQRYKKTGNKKYKVQGPVKYSIIS